MKMHWYFEKKTDSTQYLKLNTPGLPYHAIFTLKNKRYECKEPRVFTLKQVHGKEIYRIQQEKDIPDKEPVADGWFVTLKKVPVAIKVADCLSVFILSKEQKAFALLHAGWRGTKAGIVEKALDIFEENGIKPENLFVAFGPAIRGCHYTVGPEFKNFFGKWLVNENGRLTLDLFEVNRDILLKRGVNEKNIVEPPYCTYEYPELFFSYRREKSLKGNMLAIAKII